MYFFIKKYPKCTTSFYFLFFSFFCFKFIINLYNQISIKSFISQAVIFLL